jgi:hypothetical protein
LPFAYSLTIRNEGSYSGLNICSTVRKINVATAAKTESRAPDIEVPDRLAFVVKISVFITNISSVICRINLKQSIITIRGYSGLFWGLFATI